MKTGVRKSGVYPFGGPTVTQWARVTAKTSTTPSSEIRRISAGKHRDLPSIHIFLSPGKLFTERRNVYVQTFALLSIACLLLFRQIFHVEATICRGLLVSGPQARSPSSSSPIVSLPTLLHIPITVSYFTDVPDD